MLSRKETLYTALVSIFSIVVVLSNLFAAKLIRFPFVEVGVPAGVITYPLTFLIGDLVTELFGTKHGRWMVYIGLGVSVLAQGLLMLAAWLPAFESHEVAQYNQQAVFDHLFMMNGASLLSSLAAFFLSQLIDVWLYQRIKQLTGDKMLWLRNNVSTLTSQAVDTLLINFCFFVLILNAPLSVALKVSAVSWVFKSIFSISLTPLFYLVVTWCKKLVGREPIEILR